MGIFRREDGALRMDRRAKPRLRVDCEARLLMASGDWPGMLVNLSEDGAQLEMANPPRQGLSALLNWGEHEYYGKIAWVKGMSFGFTFERPISSVVVLDTVAQDREEEPSGPVANPGNIPLGRKRIRRQFAG